MFLIFYAVNVHFGVGHGVSADGVEPLAAGLNGAGDVAYAERWHELRHVQFVDGGVHIICFRRQGDMPVGGDIAGGGAQREVRAILQPVGPGGALDVEGRNLHVALRQELTGQTRIHQRTVKLYVCAQFLVLQCVGHVSPGVYPDHAVHRGFESADVQLGQRSTGVQVKPQRLARRYFGGESLEGGHECLYVRESDRTVGLDVHRGVRFHRHNGKGHVCIGVNAGEESLKVYLLQCQSDGVYADGATALRYLQSGAFLGAKTGQRQTDR